MSIYFSSTYWLLGGGADEEAKRWIALDERKKIVYSSPKAVEIHESGNYLSPDLPIPPKGFVVVVISDNEAVQDGPTLGVAHWGGDGGWIEPKEHLADQTDTPTVSKLAETPETTGTKQDDTTKTTEPILAEADFLEELKRMDEPGVQTQPAPVREKLTRYRVKLKAEIVYSIEADSGEEAERIARAMLHQLFRYGEDDEWHCEIEELSGAANDRQPG